MNWKRVEKQESTATRSGCGAYGNNNGGWLGFYSYDGKLPGSRKFIQQKKRESQLFQNSNRLLMIIPNQHPEHFLSEEMQKGPTWKGIARIYRPAVSPIVILDTRAVQMYN
jgi:hypothetical protein